MLRVFVLRAGMLWVSEGAALEAEEGVTVPRAHTGGSTCTRRSGVRER